MRKAVRNIKQSLFLYEKELFPGSVILNMRSFDAILTKGGVCPFAFIVKDCFECRSPHKNAE